MNTNASNTSTVVHRLALHVLLVVAGALGLSESASGQLEWRVSVKFILDDNGNRPGANLTTDQDVLDQVTLANAVLDSTQRGYRLNLVEIVDVAGIDEWFNATSAEAPLLEAAARLDTATYAWRTDAINVYISNDPNGSGVCSFPATGAEIILLGQNVVDWVLLHEIGHFFNLCHTQGCPCGSCDPGETGPCNDTPADDEVGDTPPDLQCWTRDDIAQWSFGMNYSALPPSLQNFVDNSFLNIMSYHTNNPDRLTDDQMDRATDSSNGSRNFVCNGRTQFVDLNGNPLLQIGNSGFPFVEVIGGVNAAVAGGIVLIRTGNYGENLTVNKRVTLRASRGLVRIGSS